MVVGFDVGRVVTIVGTGAFDFADGAGYEAMFGYPTGVAVDTQGQVFVSEIITGRIRVLHASEADISKG